MPHPEQNAASNAVAIIGAGPAGLAATRELAAAGMAIEIFDEQPRAGGNVGRVATGAPPTELERMATAQPGVTLHSSHRVTAIGRYHTVESAGPDGYEIRRFAAILLCCGAYDLALPLPGVPGPGISSAGALQALLKGQGVVPRGRVVIAGSGPFLYVAADGLARAGVPVTAVVDRLSATDYARLALPGLAVPGNGLEFMLRLWSLRRHGVRILQGRRPTSAAGGRLQVDSGEELPFDRLGLSDLFVPQSQLARTAGCRQRYSGDGGYFVTETDQDGRTSVDSIYVCGEGQGVRGWRHALLSGRLAALAALNDLGRTPARAPTLTLIRHRRRLLNAFGARLERIMRERETPANGGDSVVCACEGTRLDAVREAVDLGLRDLSSIKVVTRCGMGPCQGRYCEPVVSRLIESGGNVPTDPLNQRALTRPVPAGEFVDGV
ncbi:MAG TPA: NAD(P)/FAD-dependent oxidoreductase [Gammaproteobacteria bacterium]|nr:NAD(P)/FAD-dependent oxidoreductase [Gammaproteobacteria bacterium]